jgi:hypothetical protein
LVKALILCLRDEDSPDERECLKPGNRLTVRHEAEKELCQSGHGDFQFVDFGFKVTQSILAP